MRKHHVRELRKIDSTSYGVTLPKKAVLHELRGDDEEEEHYESARVGIEVSKTDEGNLVFEVELVSDSDGSGQSDMDEFSE